MKLLTAKSMDFENQSQGNLAVPDAKLLRKNILRSIRTLVLSLPILAAILLADIVSPIQDTFFSTGMSGFAIRWIGILLAGFLGVIAIARFVQSLADFRRARDLDQLGVMTKGLLVDKWVGMSGSKPVYYVRYKYLTEFNNVQEVGEDIFQQLKRNEHVFVLHLEHSPHVSRLDLD